MTGPNNLQKVKGKDGELLHLTLDHLFLSLNHAKSLLLEVIYLLVSSQVDRDDTPAESMLGGVEFR